MIRRITSLYLQSVDGAAGSQAEVEARIIVGEITAPVAHRFELRFAAGIHPDLGANPVAIAVGALKPEADPRMARLAAVLQEHRRATDRQNNQVHPAVVVEIPGGTATP